MTPQEALALMAQISLVPKRSHFEAHNLHVDEAGRASVEIITDASQPTISRWFEQTGACVTRLESVPSVKTRVVWFDWL